MELDNLSMNRVRSSMDASIEDFKAKAQPARLLSAVENGDGLTITERDKAVVALRSFPRIRGVSDADLAGFVSEGRP
jgi:antitoxin (DNA-binding transcriptional repressor) of toxin-antitoxin stability system